MDMGRAPARRIAGTDIVINFWLDTVRGSLLHKSRNEMVNPVTHKAGTDRWYDYVMFIDSDMAWQVDWVCDLVKQSVEFDLPIHSGLCVRKRSPYRPAIFTVNPKTGYLTSPVINPDVFDRIQNSGGDIKQRIHDVDAVGAAFVLIRRDVIEAIKPPWFFYKYLGCGGPSATNVDPETTLGDTGEDLYFLGEDVFFCVKAAEHGFKTTVDLGMWIGHVGDYIYDMTDHIADLRHRAEMLVREGKKPGDAKLIVSPHGEGHNIIGMEGLGDGLSGVRGPGQAVAARNG